MGDQSKRKCETTIGQFSDCSVGKFLLFKGTRGLFSTDFSYKEEFKIMKHFNYVLDFHYYFDDKDCARDDMILRISCLKAVPNSSAGEILYDSDELRVIDNVPQWHEQSTCFHVGISGNYKVYNDNIK